MAKHKEIVAHKVVQRQPGFLYYVDAEGNVCRSPMKKNSVRSV